VIAEYLSVAPNEELWIAARLVLTKNIIHGDAMKMLDADGLPIQFAEWGYLGKGKFQRRDFSLQTLTLMSGLRQSEFFEDNTQERQAELFAQLGNHEVFRPTKTHQPVTVRELATFAIELGV